MEDLPLLIDACAIINLFNCGLLSSACDTANLKISPTVLGECGPICAAALMSLEAAAALSFVNDSEINTDRFLSLLGDHEIGDGELESLAICETNGDSFCSDDAAARKLAVTLLGEDRVCGSLHILRKAVETNIIECTMAFAGYSKMLSSGAWLPKIAKSYFCLSTDC